MPYWRLSTFYLFYFASLGALLPYWSLYLKELGFNALAIGELMAVLMATKIVAPNLWGWIADRSGRRMAIVRLGSLLALLAFVAVFLVQSFWPLALVMFTYSFFWNAALPQFEAITLTHLGKESHRYSRIRLWGSIGFIVSVMALGPLLQHYGVGLLPWVLLILFAGIWLASLSVPDRELVAPQGEHGPPLMNVLKRPAVLALLAVCFLMQASHGPYYTFFTIYMEGVGYSRTLIGQLWALGVVAEVGGFLVMHRLMRRFDLGLLLRASLILAALRWVLIGLYAQQLWVMVGAQILHAASYGIFHATAIAFFHRYFAGRHHGQGQALYSSLSFGVGGALGAYYSGVLWEGGGGPSAAYLIAAAMAVAGYLIGRRWLRS